jgi:sialate O-acetylesterase
MTRRLFLILTLLAGWMAAVTAQAAEQQASPRLAAIFGDNMVLQRGIPLPIWGWADPGDQVAVSFQGQKKTATAGQDGKWCVKLDPVQAGGPYEMTVAGKSTVTVKNVLVGEVWVCSGQSNMEFGLGSAHNA